jgi:uncharacterized protein (TIGR04255 family)
MVSKPKATGGIRPHYAHNYLSQVIVRMDFLAPLPIPQTGPPKAIYQAIRRRFPIVENKKQLSRTFMVAEKGAVEQQEEIEEWSYFSTSRERAIRLNKSVAVLEYSKYKSFEDLMVDANSIIDAIHGAYADVQVNRLGLRYVNKITLDEGNPTEWARYLSKDLLSIFNLADKKSTIARVFQVMEFNYGDNSMRFQYGMLNPDYPAPIRKKEFILDFDSYCNMLMTKEEIIRNLNVFHSRMSEAFEQVITNGLRKKMSAKHG